MSLGSSWTNVSQVDREKIVGVCEIARRAVFAGPNRLIIRLKMVI